MDDIAIAAGSPEDIPRLEPLWVSVHHQHAVSMPELAPYVTDEVTWAERRALYEDLFRKTGTFLLLAADGDRLVGYALVHTMPASESWAGDTWITGPVIAELESIAVLPERRGSGIGSALMDEVDRILAERGVDDVVIGALPGNEGALRLYERRGFRPTWLYLSRFRGGR